MFPLIRQAEGCQTSEAPAELGPASYLVRHLRNEHDAARQALSQMREMTRGSSPGAAASPAERALWDGLKVLEADLAEHIRLENDILFPQVAELESTPARNKED